VLDFKNILKNSNIRPESIFNALISNSLDLIACTDLDHKFVFCNKNYADYIKIDNLEMICGKDPHDFFPEDYAKLMDEQNQRAIDSGEPLGLDLREIMVNGKKRVYHKLKIPLINPDNSVSGVITVFRDITEIHQQRTDSETRAQLIMSINLAARNLILGSGDKFSLSMQEALATVAISINADSCYIARFTPKEFGTPAWDNATIISKWFSEERQPAINAPEINSHLKAVFSMEPAYLKYCAEKQPEYSNYLAFNKIKRIAALPINKGDLLWGALVFESSTLEGEWDENIFYTLEVCAELIGVIIQNNINLDKLAKSYRSLEKAMLEAKRANKAKSDFLAHMSHEIRTPLNSVLGFSEIIEHETTREDHKQMLSVTVQSARSLLRLLNDILDFSRMESGRLRVTPEPYDLNEGVKAVQRIFLEAAIRKGLSLSADTRELCHAKLMLDGSRVRQILINLISNSIKFTDAGFIKINASSKPGKDTQHADVTISVTDSGRGIPEDKQKLIFHAFEQVSDDDAEKLGGAGLGLAICSNLAHMMGGEITFRQPANKGSEFILSLPDIEICPQEKKNTVEPRFISFHDLNVIIADDEYFVAEIIRRFLTFSGIENIRTTEDGSGVLPLAKEGHPDLIIIDAKMRHKNGAETVEEFRKYEREKNIAPSKIVGITALPEGREMQELEKAGCDAIFVKPLDIDEFTVTLSKLFPEKSSSTSSLPNTAAPQEETECFISQKDHDDFLRKWKNISQSMIFNELEDFSKEVIKFGENHCLNSLTDWGRTLYKQAKSFDMKQLPATIENFPVILENLREKKGING